VHSDTGNTVIPGSQAPQKRGPCNTPPVRTCLYLTLREDRARYPSTLHARPNQGGTAGHPPDDLSSTTSRIFSGPWGRFNLETRASSQTHSLHNQPHICLFGCCKGTLTRTLFLPPHSIVRQPSPSTNTLHHPPSRFCAASLSIMIEVDWKGLILPFAYVLVLLGAFTTFSTIYRKRKAGKS
jgi:hypothetical protein